MKRYFIILLIAGGLSACKKDFTDLTPTDQNSAVTFFQTEAQLRQAVTAAYVPLRDVMTSDFLLAEMRSDNTHYERSPTRGTQFESRDNIADFVNDASNSYVYDVYTALYKGISRANIVIGRIASANIAQAARNDIEGQARFLRAWNYFKLVRYFGGVPLYLTEVTNADEAFLPRASADEVYNQIIADAQDAMNKLAAPSVFPQSGQATKGSATMLLAEVYMTQKKWAEAEALLQTLAGMAYQLLPDYALVFSTANKNSRESIFEVQYLMGTQGGQQSNFIYLFTPRSRNLNVITGVTPSTGGNANNTSLGGYNTPTQDLINSYEAADKRKDASIGIAEGAYDASGFLTISAKKSIIGYTPAAGKVGVPYDKKVLNPHTDVNNTNDNWPVYRYADALLLLAEAQNEQGKSPLTALNAVRTRAGLTAVTAGSQAVLRDTIAHERRVELAFENHRWYDLVRTGKAIEVMTAFGVKQKQLYSYLRADSYTVTQNKLIYPVPKFEIEINPQITQNPGY